MHETESVQARTRVLEALVDQRLLGKAAKDTKLDRQPEVVQAMLQAQRQALVEAYIEQMLKGVAKPSDTEVNDYYTQHPELFSARRIYRIQELNLQMPSTRLPEVEAQLKQSQNLAEFSNWLKSQGIQGIAGLVVKSAEQVPTPLLSQLKNMKEGQSTELATGPDRISVLQLQGGQGQPVTLEQARSAIERVLLSAKRKTLLAAEIKKLRSTEKIEYASGYMPAVPDTRAEKPAQQ